MLRCTLQASCSVSGLGLLCAEAGVEASFHIVSRDEYANQRILGGDKYDVALTGAHPDVCLVSASQPAVSQTVSPQPRTLASLQPRILQLADGASSMTRAHGHTPVAPQSVLSRILFRCAYLCNFWLLCCTSPRSDTLTCRHMCERFA